MIQGLHECADGQKNAPFDRANGFRKMKEHDASLDVSMIDQNKIFSSFVLSELPTVEYKMSYESHTISHRCETELCEPLVRAHFLSFIIHSSKQPCQVS